MACIRSIELKILVRFEIVFVFTEVVKPPSEDEEEVQDEKLSEPESEEKSPEKEVEGKFSYYFNLLLDVMKPT